MTQEQNQQFYNWIARERISPRCPICGYGDHPGDIGGEADLYLLQTNVVNATTGRRQAHLQIGWTCFKCGFVRLFAAEHILPGLDPNNVSVFVASSIPGIDQDQFGGSGEGPG